MRGWRQLLDLEDFDGYWQCASLAWLRLRERRFHGRGPGQRHVLTLAGLQPELLTTFPQTTAGTSQLDQALRHLDFSVIPLANRWALTALLRELDEQLAVTRDLTERASSKRSPRALTQIQQQLIRTGMDSQIVAADIVHYAENEMSWRYEILDFTDVQPPALAQQMTPQASLAHTMRQGQINLGGRVTQDGGRPARPAQHQRPAHRRRRGPASPAACLVADMRLPARRGHRGGSGSRRAPHLHQHADTRSRRQLPAPPARSQLARTPRRSHRLARLAEEISSHPIGIERILETQDWGPTMALVSQCVVVDTNALWDDLRLTGIAWQVLAAATGDNPTCLRFALPS